MIVLATHLSARIVAQDGTPIVPAVRWIDTAAAFPAADDSSWINILTGTTIHAVAGKIQVAETLEQLPVAILIEGR